jgi:hypothetical protein
MFALRFDKKPIKMTEVLNLAALRSVTGTTGELRYAKGHTIAGDGGGGMFLWRTETEFTSGMYSTDNDGTIIKPTATNTGRWVRQYDGYINVNFFGALGIHGIDYTTQIQRAIDFAKLNTLTTGSLLKGTTVFIPSGSYSVLKLILRHGTSLLGESLDSTTIYPATTGTIGDYLIEIEDGPVFTNVSNLRFIGNNSNFGCFLLEAKLDPTGTHGGLWLSRFSNLNILNFKGDGIYLKGGSNYKLPNQFNIFENVRVFKGADFTHALKMTGQIGQHTFLNCEFDGFFRNNTYSRGHNVYIASESGIQTAVASFINCTIQDADYGIFIEHGENITIDNCWFENLGVAVTVRHKDNTPSRGINVLNSRFANAAGFGSLNAPNNIKSGICVHITNSFVNVHNNYVVVSDPNNVNPGSLFVFAIDNQKGSAHLANNIFADLRLGKTSKTFHIPASLSILDCGGNNFISTSGSFSSISSTLNSGESLIIIATSSVNISASANLFLGGKSSLQLLTGEVATFVKMDTLNSVTERYSLVSFTKASSI